MSDESWKFFGYTVCIVFALTLEVLIHMEVTYIIFW